jgi:hypothetical protein
VTKAIRHRGSSVQIRIKENLKEIKTFIQLIYANKNVKKKKLRPSSSSLNGL